MSDRLFFFVIMLMVATMGNLPLLIFLFAVYVYLDWPE